MIKYKFEDQGGVHIYTREEILKEYFPYWSNRMFMIGKGDEINEDNCIEDWIAVSWAREIKVGAPIKNYQSMKTHCKHGHEFTEENTKIKNGKQRICLTCVKMNNEKRRKAVR